MSRSMTVASPSTLGVTFTKVLPSGDSYVRIFVSGFVAKLNIGCSIEAASPLGAASKISQTNMSPCSCRRGNKGDRATFVLSPTETQPSCFYPPHRAFTHPHPNFVLSPTKSKCVRAITHPHLWITLAFYRVITHHLSCFYTPSIVLSHTEG